ncbi:MAG: hypothetical protein AAGC55_29425, partial [Myxococcota bacterium]
EAPTDADEPAAPPRLLVLYGDDDQRLRFQTLAVDGDERWSPVGYVDTQTRLAGDPAVVELGAAREGRLAVFAPSDGQLIRWEFDPRDESWSGPAEVTWSDGAPVAPCDGIGLTRGYLRQDGDSPGPEIVAVIPSGPMCRVTMARYQPDSGRFAALAESPWSSAAPMIGGRPGLAYVPFDPEKPEDGRFFLAWKPYPSGAALVSMTEGNDQSELATSRRLRWLGGIFLVNVWDIVAGSGISLVYDPRFDQRMRATWAFSADSEVLFYPLPEGIEDYQLRDQYDYSFIRQTLSCSLNGTCTPLRQPSGQAATPGPMPKRSASVRALGSQRAMPSWPSWFSGLDRGAQPGGPR